MVIFVDKNKIIDLLGLSEFKEKIISLIPTKTSQLQNDSKFKTTDDSITLTNSLLATEEGTALDATQGKVLNDKGEQMGFYQDDDGVWHFRDWTGADTVIPFSNNNSNAIYYLPGVPANFTSIIEGLGKTVSDFSVANFRPVYNYSFSYSYTGNFVRGNTSASVYGGSASGTTRVSITYSNGTVSWTYSGNSASHALNSFSASISANTGVPGPIGFIFDPSDTPFSS